MPHSSVVFLVIAAITLFPTLGSAQESWFPSLPKELKVPLTKTQQDQRQSLKEYARGQLCLREERLIEAMRCFEDAVRLDPTAVGVYKALLPLYAGFDRGNDVIKTCRKILSLAPNDSSTCFTLGEQLQRQGLIDDAVAAYEKGLANLSIKDGNSTQALKIHYQLGVLRSQDQPNKAIKNYGNCVDLLAAELSRKDLSVLEESEMKSRCLEILEKIGQLHLRDNNFDEAINAFQRSMEIYPEAGGKANWHLAQIYMQKKDHAKALEYVDRYLKFQPQDFAPYEMKVTLLNKLGRRVLPWLTEECKNNPYNTELQLLLGKTLASSGNLAGAERHYKELCKDQPKAEVYLELFRMYQSEKQFGMLRILQLLDETFAASENVNVSLAAKAKSQARAMVGALQNQKELAKELLDFAFPMLQNGQNLQFQTVYTLAILSDQIRDAEKSEAFYARALSRRTPSTEALVYGGLLRALWAGKKYQRIVEVCREGLENAQATNRILFHSDLARAYANLKQNEKAIREASEAVKLASDSNRLAMEALRIQLYVRAGKQEEAEKICLQLLEEHKQPGDIIEIRYALSNVYTQRKLYSKAEEQLQLIIDVDSTNATAFNDLGYLWADRGKNLEKAEEYIRRALELHRDQRRTILNPKLDLNEDNAAYVDSLGWVLFRRGKINEARETLERATKLQGGDDPVIWDHLGDVYFRLEKTKDAFHCWAKALELYEENDTRVQDDRYRDLQQKIQLLKTSIENNK